MKRDPENTQDTENEWLRVGKNEGRPTEKTQILDTAVSILQEPNEVPLKETEPTSEEDAFDIVVARTLSRLCPQDRLLTKKKINDVLFEAKYHASEQATAAVHAELSSYNPMYGLKEWWEQLNISSLIDTV